MLFGSELELEAREYLSSLRASNRLQCEQDDYEGEEEESLQIMNLSETIKIQESLISTSAENAVDIADDTGGTVTSSTVADDLGLFLQQELSSTAAAAEAAGDRATSVSSDEILNGANFDHMLDPMSLASLFEESNCNGGCGNQSDLSLETQIQVGYSSNAHKEKPTSEHQAYLKGKQSLTVLQSLICSAIENPSKLPYILMRI